MSVRALVLADTDSYVKWGASLVSGTTWDARIAVLDAHAAPSRRQVGDALHGTGAAVDQVTWTDRSALRALLRSWAPEVLVLAVRAHAVSPVLRLVGDAPSRPVVVTGVAGICVPVQWYDVNLRRGADVFVVHSRRERRDLVAIAARHHVPHQVALATLPFLRAAVRRPVAAGPVQRSWEPASAPSGPIVFAPQSLVPHDDAGRETVLRGLAAAVGPGREVHVKVRSRAGEVEAHRGAGDYAALLARLHAGGAVPEGLRVVDGPMSHHLRTASGFVTVGSSAALEAVAAGVPTVVLTDLGVDDAHLNSVFVGSGLLGTLSDVAHGRFRQVDRGWAHDNYFHDPRADDWQAKVEDLLAERDRNGLPPPALVPPTLGNRVRDLYYRLDALAPWRGTALEPLERLLLAAARWLNRAVLHLR